MATSGRQSRARRSERHGRPPVTCGGVATAIPGTRGRPRQGESVARVASGDLRRPDLDLLSQAPPGIVDRVSSFVLMANQYDRLIGRRKPARDIMAS